MWGVILMLMDEKIIEFKSQNLIEPKISAVYGIYSRDGECLWIGESENLYSRLDDHYHSSRGSTIRGCVENDESIDISIENLWEETALRTYPVSGETERKRLETRLIQELEPRYNKQSRTQHRTTPTEAQTSSESQQSPSESGMRYDVPDVFHRFVLNWNWPDPPSRGTKQAENVVGVIYRLMMMDDFSPAGFNTALQNRADEARNTNRSLGERYEDTVRDGCVRGLGFYKQDATRETASKDFLAESRKLVRTYKEEYR
jgi:hypothetical protein